MSSVTVGMIYLWDLRNNALIRSFAQVGDEVGIFPSSSLQPGGCGSLRSGNRDMVEGCHSLATTAEGEKLLKPRSPGRVPEPAAPLQYQPPLQSSSDLVRPGRVQPPCKCPQCREVREDRHNPTSPLCLLQKAGSRRGGTGRPWDTALVRHRRRRWLPAPHRSVTPSPRKGSLVATRPASGLHESCAHLSWHSSAPGVAE